MGWDSRSPRRDRRDYARDEWRDDVAARGRSRSTSRDRHTRRRSRSTSRRRARRDSGSPDGRYRRRSSSTSRSPERRRRHRSRSRSPPRHYRSSYSPPPDLHPPWHPGPGAEVVPPWRQQPPGPESWLHPDGAAPPGPVFYEGREIGSSRWDRPGRGSDQDREWSEERGRLAPGPGPGPGFDIPTASVFIKGLPYDADESDLHAVFAGFPNILSIKVLRDRMTGRGKGTAFIDFESVDDARLLMESEARYNSAIGGQVLFLDYSSGPPGGAGQGPAGGPALDWICDMCSSVNFARRLECYHCSSARPANPRRVTGDLNEPSNILKVSGLEPHTSEEALYQAMAAVGHNILDLRVIKDKYTGAPRGFAFVELPTVAAAGSLMQACQGMVLQGHSLPLKICYAKAKEQVLGSAKQAVPGAADAAAGPAAAAVAAISNAAAAKAAAAGPLGWKPKEFNPDGSTKQEHQQQQQQQQQPQVQPSAQAAASDEAAASGAAAAGAQAAAGPGPSSEAATGSAAAAAAAGVDAATIQAMTQAGFEYQASSGYWWDAKSGYFYDANTQLYYHHSTNQWYQYNADTGQYTAVGGEQQQQQHQQVQGQQQYSMAGEPAGAAAQQQPQQQPQQKQASAVDKRRRAVIGSAPQYNPEGLLAAAALAEEREAEQRRIAAAKAARERQQEQQNKHTVKQPKLMQGKPGIGMLPGTTAAPPQPAPVVPRLAQVVAEGDVQGVVYRSKWSQQRAAQQS